VSEDGQKKYSDSYCVCAYGGGTTSEIWLYRGIGGLKFNGPDGFKQINTWINWTRYNIVQPTSAKCILWQSADDHFDLDIKPLLPPQGTWGKLVLRTDQPSWVKVGNADWRNPINGIGFYITHTEGCVPHIRLDHLHFSDCRYSAMQQDTGSQSAYGLRELTETDEELKSDNECLLRAKALLDYYSQPTEHLTIKSTVIDYGDSPLLPGDKVFVSLPNENVSGYFRIESVEYRVSARTQTLEITLELGREKPLLADYLYLLKARTESLSRYKAGGGRV
jgi:hypothetical protein